MKAISDNKSLCTGDVKRQKSSALFILSDRAEPSGQHPLLLIITKKINKIKVLPISYHAPKPKEILGYDLFEEIYSNTLICHE